MGHLITNLVMNSYVLWTPQTKKPTNMALDVEKKKSISAVPSSWSICTHQSVWYK